MVKCYLQMIYNTDERKTFFTSAFISMHLLRCETLEIDNYACGFRRLASASN